MEKLLTVTELAECLGISPGTAYHWLSQGRLPCIKFSSRCVRFRECDVQKMLEQLGHSGLCEERKQLENAKRRTRERDGG